jgi:hypothetical protein
MANYSHPQPHPALRPARGGDQLHYGWAVTVLAAVIMAAMAWAWSQQQTVDSLLPQPVGQTAALTPPATQAVAAAGDTRAPRP